jgi:hypothetical protein
MAQLVNPEIDFSQLGNLGNVYRKAQADDLRQQTLASLGQGGPADAAALLKSGDLSLAQLGVNLQNRSADDAWRREEAARTQKNADRSYGLQVRTADRQDEGPVEKAAQREKLLRLRGIDPNSPEGKAYVIAGEWTGPGAGGASLNPVYGVGPDGKPAMVQTTKTGQAIQTRLPEGFQISKDPIKIDAGTHFQLLDPQTRQVVGTLPKDVAGAEREKVIGEETGKGQVALPQLLATSSQTLKAIEDVRNHPGRGFMTTGAMGGMPGIPGTSGRGFTVALDQLKGKTFLEAFNALRGGGAITEAEGSKATNAMARLDRAQNKEDFESGLNDLRDVVKAGMMRAAAKARGAGKTMAQDAPAAAQPAPGSITQEQYEALPSGTPFTAPDGSPRIKP